MNRKTKDALRKDAEKVAGDMRRARYGMFAYQALMRGTEKRRLNAKRKSDQQAKTGTDGPPPKEARTQAAAAPARDKDAGPTA